MNSFLRFLNRVLIWFGYELQPSMKPRPSLTRQPRDILYTDEEVALHIKAFRETIHGIDSGTWKRKFFSSIPPVKVTVKFGGWGFVEGRTSGYRINRRLVIVPHDDCMDFTSVCLLLDGNPTLILEERRGCLTVEIIVQRDYMESVLNPSTLDCSDLAAFRRLVMPLQKTLGDVFAKVYEDSDAEKRKEEAESQVSIERLLHY